MADQKKLKLSDYYLMLYNVLCCFGWSQVLAKALFFLYDCVVDKGIPLDQALSALFVSGLAEALILSQLAALLEIVHAAVGLVRSPVLITVFQVSSRIGALFSLIFSPAAAVHPGTGLMIIAWSMAEIPRYAFYFFAVLSGDATKGTPYPLFWMRYSMFMILYPAGITGEMCNFYAAARDPKFIASFPWAVWIYKYLVPALYLPGSPYMIMNMIGNRKKAFKKRFAKPPPPPRGIAWPIDKKGTRSSTDTNKGIVAAAFGAVNKDKANVVNKAKGWRFGYVKHLTALVEEQCKSPEAALKMAQAGIDYAYDVFEFIAPDGSAVSLKEAMASKSSEKFNTGFVKGEASAPAAKELIVPYKGGELKGEALKDKVQYWVEYGTIEPSAGEAINNCIDNPSYMDLSDKYFVLLGAGSAMGPFLVLMALGANVIAVDLDRKPIWERLIRIAKKSPGSITFPLKIDQKECTTESALCEQAGCNLFTDTPKIRDWLLDLYPGKAFTVGSYAYLNGALHVQVSLAMDAITRDLSEKRPNTSLAYLCTPTDLHLVPKESYEAVKANIKEFSNKPFCMFMNGMSNGKYLRKNFRNPIGAPGGKEYYLVNGISVAQGPNYALAKRLQHWRAIIAHSKGCKVSSNIAPSTSTVSVVQNRTFAWAYEGMPYFKPYEIFAPETSNSVMSALLFNDINNPKSVANPKNKLDNPNQLFSYGSWHGGCWRAAYMIDSIGESSVLLYFSRISAPYLGAAIVLTGIANAVLNNSS